VKRPRRIRLAQSFEWNILGNRYHKRSSAALRNEVLSIDHDGTDVIAQAAERSVRFFKMLSAIGDDKAEYVLSNENRRTLPAFV